MCIPLISHWRWELVLRAQVWRALMALGMNFHRLPHPRPPAPAFRKRIKTTVSPHAGEINLLFYTPTDYQRPRGSDKAIARGYPAVVNFHGGGFTLGQASDDARWADAVVRNVNAVVVCVDYRLAPEHPFPTAVEDGVDAVLYLVANSNALGIDPHRIATSGFSAGGNLAFTVPLKLQDLLNNPSPDPDWNGVVNTAVRSSVKDVLNNPYPDPEREQDGVNNIVVTSSVKFNPILHPIVAIAAWYPITDFATYTRRERRHASIRPDKDLPTYFTELFDASYLHPISEVCLSNPYLSPGLAPERMLRVLPDHIIVYTCEWDELRMEAERMRDRLTDEAEKQVLYRKVARVAHAWDKSPNPLKWDLSIEEVYQEVCAALRRAFDIASHEF